MADLNRRLRANSAPPRERTRGDGSPLDPSPFGDRRSDRLRTTGAADSEAVDENGGDFFFLMRKNLMPVTHMMVQHLLRLLHLCSLLLLALKFAILFSNLLQIMANPNGLHFPSDTFLKFLHSSGGQLLFPEASESSKGAKRLLRDRDRCSLLSAQSLT